MRREAWMVVAVFTLSTTALAEERIDLGGCHDIRLTGPAERLANYREKLQNTFSTEDPAIVALLRTGVMVDVPSQYRDPSKLLCGRFEGVPQKLVLTRKGRKDVIKTIGLEAERLVLRNSFGATSVAFGASAVVSPEELRDLGAQDFDVFLVYADPGIVPLKGTWKKGLVEKVLRGEAK